MLQARIQEFALVQLSPGFGGLIGFVKQAEAALATGKAAAVAKNERRSPCDWLAVHFALRRQPAALPPDCAPWPGKIQDLIDSFANNWRKLIGDMNADIMRSFTNFQNGTAILQEALTQLVLYYEKFTAILKKVRVAATGGRLSVCARACSLRLCMDLVGLCCVFFCGLQDAFHKPGGWPNIVDRHQLMVEVKKHKTTF